MLQQILQDLYIDPEILAELDDEQKQILFCKMREEQVRRWREHEKKIEESEKTSKKTNIKKNKKDKHVGFLEDKTGAPWTWVMGEHELDKSIETILEEEAQSTAETLAQTEAEELILRKEKEMQQQLKEEKELLEKERAAKEAECRRKSEEAALYQSLKEARLAAQKLEEETKKKEQEQKEKLADLKTKSELQRQRSLDEIHSHKVRRSSEIYMSFRQARENLEQQAEELSEKVEEEWKEQEKKAKEKEAEIREVARRAREEHRRSIKSLKTHSHLIGMMLTGLHERQTTQSISRDPDVPPKVRPSKPTNRDSVIEWFRDCERQRGAGVDNRTNQIAPWFHGIITRQESEQLLSSCQVGSFLVRVSERIWGYAVSYKAEKRCKHFLIDSSEGHYQFFGTNQIPHYSLYNLIEHHMNKPISSVGGELLLHPCAQNKEPPDYEDLFQDSAADSSYL